MKRYTKGFTLVELLVVIAIIGILASIVVVSLNNARTRARDTERLGEMNQIRTALESYFERNGDYPTAAEGLQELVTAGDLPAFPTQPGAAATPYGYGIAAPCSSTTRYVLYVALEAYNQALANDYDTNECGATCNDGANQAAPWNYCIRP